LATAPSVVAKDSTNHVCFRRHDLAIARRHLPGCSGRVTLTRSLSGVLKRVKNVVDRFGDARRKRIVLEQLNDVDHRLPILGESAIDSIARIEKLLVTSAIIETTDAVKLRAAQRAIDRRAPFHRQRNGIDDAILIETYADRLTERAPRTRFAFVTHNTKDFSHPTGNDKLPHPDIAPYLSRIRSLFFVSLAEARGG
jgi:PIN domain